MSAFSDIGNLMCIYLDTIEVDDDVDVDPIEVKAAAKSVKASKGRNWIPVIVTQFGEDEYRLIGNRFVYEAMKETGLEKVWVIVADDSKETERSVKALEPKPHKAKPVAPPTPQPPPTQVSPHREYRPLPTLEELNEQFGEGHGGKACYGLVDVSLIKSATDLTQFEEDYRFLILEMAFSITRLRTSGMGVEFGLVRPLPVRRTALEEYYIFPGSELAYLACKKARELEPRKCEMIAAMVCHNSYQQLEMMHQSTLY